MVNYNSSTETSISIAASSASASTFISPNNITTQLSSYITNNNWHRIWFVLKNLNSAAKADIYINEIGTTLVNTVSNVDLGFDYNSSDKKNPALWNKFGVHFEGLGGKLDNVTFKKVVDVTGINERGNLVTFALYPSPSSDFINILVPNEKWNNQSYRIKDITGKTVSEGKIQSNLTNIDVADLVSGIYFFQAPDGTVQRFQINKI